MRKKKNLYYGVIYKIFGDTSELKKLFFNKYFYISLIVLFSGLLFNQLADYYLYNLQSTTGKFQPLYDLILNNIPYIPLGFFYDWGALFAIVFFVIYVIYSRGYNKIPYYLVLIGSFQILRSIFVVLTPLGHPVEFQGTNSRFNGFTKYDLGLYPSGHAGSIFLLFLIAKGIFKAVIFAILLIIIISLFFTRGHYSIDVLSGMIFAYAIYSFVGKHLKKKFIID